MSDHIYIDKDTTRPCIVGTGIRVWDVYVMHEREGRTPDEIVGGFPQLSLAKVHAALAYYWDHKAEIDEAMRQADEFVEELRAANGRGPLAEKLERMGRERAQVSSR